jgi:hypothetical protein
VWAGPALGAALGVPGVARAALAGAGGFLLGAQALGRAGRALRRAADERRGAAPRSLLDRSGGLLFGAARGAVLVLLVGVLGIWLDAAREAAAPGTPAAAETPLRAATRAVLARGFAAAVGDEGPGADVAVRVMTRPGETLGAMRRVAEHPGVAAIADDRAFWDDVEAGRIEFALARASFRSLAADPDVRRDLAAAGAIDPAAAADPARFRAAFAPVLAEVGPRIARLRSDPELLRLAGDPAVADALARRDVVALLLHPGLQRVVSRALADAPAG